MTYHFVCDRCDEAFGTPAPPFVYRLADGLMFPATVVLSRCDQCGPAWAERMPTDSEVQSFVEALGERPQDDLDPVTGESYPVVDMDHVNQVVNQWLSDRVSQPRCISCCSVNHRPLAMSELLAGRVEHPGCGGHFKRGAGIVAGMSSPRTLTTEGIIEE